MTYNTKRTNSIISKVNYEIQKPVSSADLNEVQSIVMNNLINLITGKGYDYSGTPQSYIYMSLDYVSTSIDTTNIYFGIQGSRYLIRIPITTIGSQEYNNYVGSLEIESGIVNLQVTKPTVDTTYYVKLFAREIELLPGGTVYLNGIRSNLVTTGITEQTTTNNIYTELVGEEVSSRSCLEITFTLSTSSDQALTGWDYSSNIGTLTYDYSSNTTTFKRLKTIPLSNLSTGGIGNVNVDDPYSIITTGEYSLGPSNNASVIINPTTSYKTLVSKGSNNSPEWSDYCKSNNDSLVVSCTRNITAGTSDPVDSSGNIGDIYIKIIE